MRRKLTFIAGLLLASTAAVAQVSNISYGPPTNAGGTGTVTSVGVTTANGVSGTVANPTTTPAISVTLGAITPSSVASSGAVSGTTVTGTGLGTFAGVKSSTGSYYRDDGSQILSGVAADSITRFYAPGSGVFDFLNSAGTVNDLQIDNSGNAVTAGTVSGTNLTTGGLPASIATGTIIGRSAAGTGVASALTVLPTADMPALTGDVTNSAGSLGTTIATNIVTYAKFQQVAASSLVGNPTGSLANAQGITLAGGLGFSGSTLTAAGALTPTSVASTGSILSSGATGGVGYATGAGGAVTQITSRATGVTNNKACGAITMFSAAGSATWATFTVTDSAVAATDTIIANEKSGTNLYMLAITSIGSGTFNLSFATTGGTATDAPVINYCVIKGVAA